MSIQEKKAVFNIVSSILIIAGYIYYTFVMNAADNLPLHTDAKFWALFTLKFMGITIGVKIIFHIIFHIILKGIHKEEDPDFMDEYDKTIEMKSERNGNYFFFIGFVLAMIPVATDKPIYYMFIILLSGGFIAGTLGDVWKLYYYKKGL